MIEIGKIVAALRELQEKGIARMTPVIQSTTLSKECGCRIFLKLECEQETGAYKVRGAYNCMRIAVEEAGDEGADCFVAASAGNHAQGVGLAARKLDRASRTHIFMPATAPRTKLEKTLKFGVMVHLPAPDQYGSGYEGARKAAAAFVKSPLGFMQSGRHCFLSGETPPSEKLKELSDQGLNVHLLLNSSFDEKEMRDGLLRLSNPQMIHAFDDESVIAGQGTVGLEILEQVPDVNVIVVPVGGGGLVAGVVEVVRQIRPQVKVYGVQAAETPAMIKALEKKSYDEVEPISLELPPGEKELLADGINVQKVGELTYEIASAHHRRTLDFLVADQESVKAAIYKMWSSEALKLEGAGAIGVAPFLESLQVPRTRDDFSGTHYFQRPELLSRVAGKTVVIVLSGRNIDEDRWKITCDWVEGLLQQS